MKPFLCKLCGGCCLTIGVSAEVWSLVTRGEHVSIPWPVGLILFALGVFLLRQGGGAEGWTEWLSRGPHRL